MRQTKTPLHLFLHLVLMVFLLGSAFMAAADPYPPTLVNGAAHFPAVAWPAEPSDPAQCGASCGEWLPYTRFQSGVADPRVQDPSNGGTSPQNYVNISSSCTDKSKPSIYYALRQGAALNGSDDVILFRWRVEQIANTYATGPSAGNYGATDPWSSALWSVLFDINGDGFLDLAAHLDGSSGAPSVAVDRIAGIWSTLPTQSLDYLGDPTHVKLIAHNPTAYVDAGTNRVLNFQNALNPVASWPNGSSETNWDYGTTRSKLVSSSPCNEYFIDYQIPVKMLDASSLGGPKITRSSPISMLFCTANSLNNPFQKDCAINASWIGAGGQPAPFGDYISFNQSQPYAQPIVASVTATAPNTCPGNYTLSTEVQDTLAIVNGKVAPSVKGVKFFYYYDINGDGVANDGSSWTFAADATRNPGSYTTWSASWSGASLLKGSYLIGVQAVDDNTVVDLGVTPSGVDNRTFSYVTGDASNRLYVGGTSYASLPAHAPTQSPSGSENWYGNPAVTGSQVALVGLALNTCGVAPTLSKSASLSNIATGGTLSYTLTLNNTTGAAITATQINDSLPAGFSYQSTTSVTNGGANVTPTSLPTLNATGTVAWNFNSLSIANNSSLVLTFVAKAGSAAGTYNNRAGASTSFGTLTSSPVTVQVDSARLSLSKTPNVYSIDPDGSTQLTYTLAYSNDSAVSVTAASISDPLPTGVTFVSCSSACSNNSGTLNWALGTLAGGASGSVTVTVTVNTNYASTSLSNTATLSATAPESSTVSNSATAKIAVNVPAPAFTLSKTASTALGAYRIDPAGTVTWTIAYKNYGTGTASGMVITDPLPAGFTYSSCAFTGGTPTGASCSQSNGTVTWNWGSGTVAAGASGSVTVVATAAASPFSYPNPAPNTATLTWTGNSTGVSATNLLGVTGQTCSAAYYFKSGLTADSVAPTSATTGTSTVLNTTSSPTVVFMGSAATSQTVLNGNQLSVSFYIDPAVGGLTLTAQVDRVKTDTTISNITTYSQSSLPNTAGWYTFSFNFTAGTSDLLVGEKLKFTFTASGNSNKNLTLYYGGYSSVKSVLADSHASVCSATSPANLSLTKTTNLSNVAVASLPASIQYTLAFANLGGTAATGATVVDTLPANLSFVSATLNGSAVTPSQSGQQLTFSNVKSSTDSTAGQVSAGASGTIVINGTVVAGASGTLTNNASFSATGLTAVQAAASTTVGSLATGSPSLSISKAVSKSLLTAGDATTYTLTVVNLGQGNATTVTVSDVLPANSYFTYGSCTTAIGSCSQSGGTLSWSLGSLAAGASASLTFTMNVAATGVPAGVSSLNNTATVSDSSYCTGGTPPASCTSNTVTVSVSGNPNISISKSASPATVAPGGLVTYTLTVSNSGSAAATGVLVKDPVPAHLSFKAITSSGSGSGSFDAVNNQVVFNVGTLAAGASTTLSFTATVGTLSSGTTILTNTASATASNAPSKTAVASNSATAAPVMTLSKSGPASLPFPAATLTAAANASTSVFVNSAILLEVGDWVQVVNGSGNPVVQITAISGNVLTLASVITASSGTALRKAGIWSLAYQNTGNADASSVVVSDPLPSSWIYVGSSPAASSAPGVGSTGTVSWSLGTVAAAASGTLQLWAVPTITGGTTNTATLSATGLANVNSSASLATGGVVVSKATTTPTSSAGGTAHYVISISNSLGSPVAGLTVTDALPTGFSYKSATAQVGGSQVEPAFGASDAIHNQPIWSSVTVPANSTLTIAFDANIDASVGAATYQNAVTLGNVPAGVASVPFDPLSTTAEDVTVLAANTGIVQGYVFRDANSNGSYDAGSDPIYAGIGVSIVVGGTTYTVATDSNGFFSRVVPAGSASVTVDTSALPAGLQLTAGNANPGSVTVSSGAVSQKDTGFVVVSPVLAVSKSHSGSFVAGGSGSYTVTVSNSGGATTSGTVTLTDTAPSGMTVTAMSGSGWSCSSLPSCTRSDALAAGASYPAITVTVSVSAGASSPLLNSVTASGGGSANATATDSTTIAQAAAWQITKTHSGSMTAGGTGSYTVTVTNSGASPSAASTVTVSDTPPTGMTVTSMSGTGWTCTGASCTRSDSLAAGASYPTLTVGVSIASNAGTPLVNSITVSGGGVASSATATDSTTIVQPPAFKIDKAATASVLTGGTITYTVTLTNIGGSTSGTSATVLDALPAGVTVTGVTPVSGINTVSCANYTSPFSCTVTLSAGLAVNGTASFTYTATAPGTAGTVVNKISVDPTGGTNPQDPTQTCTPTTACASASTTVNAAAAPAAFQIGKSATASVLTGGTITYTVTLTNIGGSTSGTSATVKDALPTGVTVTGVTPGSGVSTVTCANYTSPFSCTVTLSAGLAVNGTASFSYTATAPSTTGRITNYIAVDPTGGSTVPNDPSVGCVATSCASADTTVSAAPLPAAWTITKTHSGNMTAGGTGSYTITVTNSGGSSTTASTVTVTDTPPTGMTVTGMSGTNWVCANNSGWACTRSDALAASASYEAITVSVSIASNAGTSLVNATRVAGGGVATDGTTTDSTAIVQPAAFQIGKSATASVQVGGTITYTITLTNIGGSTSGTSATVKDVLPAGVSVTAVTAGSGVNTLSCGTLPLSSSFTCTVTLSSGLAVNGTASFTYTATAPGTAGSITNYTSVDPTGGSSPAADPTTTCTPTTACASASTTVTAAVVPPAFQIGKTGPASVVAGGSMSYTITLSNIGGSTSGTSATVKDVLPAGVSVTAVTPGSGVNGVSCGANFNSPMVCTVTLSAGLAVNGTASFSYTATAPGTAGTVTNYISVDPTGGSSPLADPTAVCSPTTACASASTTVIGPDVYTTISAPSSVANGAVANLVLTFGNQGAVAAQGVTYQLTLPTTVTGVSCGAASCSFNATTGVLTLTGLPAVLVPGQQLSANVSYRAPATGSTALNATSLIATSTPGETPTNNNSASAVTTLTAAATQADPTTGLRAPATAYPSSTVAVDVSYTNLGADNASGLGFAVSGFPNTGTPAFSYNGIACSWNQATGAVTGCGLPSTLPVGQTITLRASYTAPASGLVTLTSTVSSTSADANTGNNTATAVTTVVAQPVTPVADVTTSVSVPSQAYGGSTVLVPLAFQNLGPASALNLSYAVSLTGGASNVQVSNNGVLCTYNGGSIGGCNLPSTLTAGQAVNLVLSFTAPAAPATVGVTSTVGTGTTESNTGNNSASGNLSVPTLQPTGTISGRVWYDANRNRRYDAGEVGRAGWSVDLLQGGSPIARATTDSNGQYSFTGLADGVYAVRFMPWMGSGTLPVNGESGTAITGGGIPGQSILDNIVIANVGTRNFRLKIGGDVVTEQSLPIDPSGTVYNSNTRQPIAGAMVTLGYACGAVDPSWLAGTSTVTTGADGSYAFFLLPAAPSACNYTLTVSKAGFISPSTVIPSSGSWPAGGGAVTGVSGAPSGGQATTYYLSGPKPTTDVTNNNIPLDPQAVAAGTDPASVPTLSTWAVLLLMTGLAVLAGPGLARKRVGASR